MAAEGDLEVRSLRPDHFLDQGWTTGEGVKGFSNYGVSI